MGRPKHPDRDHEAVLRQGESQGWRVVKARKYFKLKCPCDDRHMKMMHISPSDPNYLTNWKRHMSRHTCWEDQ